MFVSLSTVDFTLPEETEVKGGARGPWATTTDHHLQGSIAKRHAK